MECPRGSITTETNHKVTTLKGASEWVNVELSKSDLPLTVIQHKAKNGRIMIQIFNCDGKLLEKRG